MRNKNNGLQDINVCEDVQTDGEASQTHSNQLSVDASNM